MSAELWEMCLPSWRAAIEQHRAQVPYSLFQQEPSNLRAMITGMNLDWSQLMLVRGWCRVRAGLMCVRHLRGKRSRAEHQSCVFCGLTVRNGVKHVIGLCERWEALRAPLLQELPGHTTDSSVLSLMGTSPEDDRSSQVLAFFAAVDKEAPAFWLNKM